MIEMLSFSNQKVDTFPALMLTPYSQASEDSAVRIGCDLGHGHFHVYPVMFPILSSTSGEDSVLSEAFVWADTNHFHFDSGLSR